MAHIPIDDENEESNMFLKKEKDTAPQMFSDFSGDIDSAFETVGISP